MLLLFLLFLNSLHEIKSSKLPNFIQPCPNMLGEEDRLNDCLLSQTKTVVNTLKDGSNELEIPPLDPLQLDLLHLSLHDDFIFSLHNLTISGLSDCSFMRLKINNTENNLQMSIHFKKITIVGYYKLLGFLFVAQVNSSGYTSMVFDDVILNVKMPMSTIQRDSIPYLLLPRAFDAGITFSGVSVEFENLFPSEPVLGTIVNKFINDNFDDLFQVMRPGVLDVLKHNLHKLFFKLLAFVPVDEIFKMK
ncbi:protein takeout-like [Onthophagus taurus]|uniref:protein takeout-like n=1 Tax=Onthophagus taurus TaxID=166361 RepID=UPI000C20220F|nr:uncharacterized protein LOC111421749 isoform X2 [Onthophagus taurus]XP_022912319.1 uncharacterized protein LOC111423305 isoform X2 [Onthophagus taurus]